MISPLGKDVGGEEDFVIFDADISGGAQGSASAVKYVRRIEELIGAPVALLSTSPQRDDTILMRDPFQD